MPSSLEIAQKDDAIIEDDWNEWDDPDSDDYESLLASDDDEPRPWSSVERLQRRRRRVRVPSHFRYVLFQGFVAGICSIILLIVGVVCIVEFQSRSSPSSDNVYNMTPPVYACPANPKPVDKSNVDEPAYYASRNAPIRENFEDFIKNFRTKYKYDGWGYTYEQMARSNGPWKRDHLNGLPASNAAIYESAAGIGLNLLMTAEVLTENFHLENVTIYGNEYIAESVELAKKIFEAGVYPDTVSLGQYCTADSRNLYFIPPERFDLVMTGYITPLQDPMRTGDDKWKAKALKDICGNQKAESKMQRIQEKWYNDWIMEMVRLAKPGAPILVEQVSVPLCENSDDWGGVPRDFWKSKAESWNVDPASIQYVNDTLMPEEQRYHVFMRKDLKR